ncbi:MAG TPA: EscU/YscU/HrcU family type III secretion system export apparatus switch protein [Halanaerobiales bacterium]|nr:EscU/YscU/HrcU family type III secretion system export apparatus switch protein [Halanaerobiales bacterium]
MKQKQNKDNKISKEEINKAAALRYNEEKDTAPRIIASGKGELARRIIETAKKHDIPLKEEQDIIDILLKLNIGEEIPTLLYQAVAEILSFIYSLE